MLDIVGGKREEHLYSSTVLAGERGEQSDDDGDDVQVRFIRVSRCEARRQ